jgi:acetolactate synthase-1/2/3 large subunit
MVQKGRPAVLGKAEWGSDVIVDMLRALDYEYIALNPGATFRGLHDSLVNYGGNTAPETILCTHEEIAVAIAHGYAVATGRPMAAAVHNIVGLLHASMGIFNAWEDRMPVLVLGGTGPMATEQRRPWIDWIHTALVQGNAVRDFVKWDDQPSSVQGFIDSLLRAQQVLTTEPRGPVYINFDAALQELRLDQPLPIPDVARYAAHSRVQGDAEAMQRAADLLAGARRPVILANGLGGSPEAVVSLLALAEKLPAPVVDMGSLYNFPSTHPLNLTGAATEILKDADVILALDVLDLQQALSTLDRATRMATSSIPESAQIIDISLRQFKVRSWVQDFGRIYPTDVPISADCAIAIPALAELCLKKVDDLPDRVEARRQRAAALQERHAQIRSDATEAVGKTADQSPISVPFMVQQVWEAARSYDWTVTDSVRSNWVGRLWDITKPEQYLVSPGGGGVGGSIGRALGIALAHKGTGKLPIQFQGDGDLMMAPGALWTAARHRIPALYVINNNRSYYNDEDHQGMIAKTRGRPEENKHVAIRLEDPNADFASLARSLGVHGEGPIEKPEDLGPALARAARVVVEEGRPAIVDVVAQNR